MESENPNFVDGESGGSDENCELLSHETLHKLIKEIEQSYSKSRNCRIELLSAVASYFANVATMVTNVKVQSNLVKVAYLMQGLMVEVTKVIISLSKVDDPIYDVYDIVWNMGPHAELISKAIYTRCKNTGVVFGKQVENFMESLLAISAANKDTWLYSVFVSPMALHMMNAFFTVDYDDFTQDWCYQVKDLIMQIGDNLLNCRDYACQYYLIKVISLWANLIVPEVAVVTIKKLFENIIPDQKIWYKMLWGIEDPTDQIIRTFLNSLNSYPAGPQSIKFIRCLSLILDHKEFIMPDEDCNDEFWVNFSLLSGRMHAFVYCPEAAMSLTFNINKEQIESACIEQKNAFAVVSPSGTDNPVSAHNDEILILRVDLNVDLDRISTEAAKLCGKEQRSISFAFLKQDEKLVQSILEKIKNKPCLDKEKELLKNHSRPLENKNINNPDLENPPTSQHNNSGKCSIF